MFFIIFANPYYYRKIISSFVINLKFGNYVLTNSNVVTYLGLRFDWDANWTLQIESVISSGKVFVPMFYRLRGILDEDTLVYLIRTLVIPRLMYGLLIYGNSKYGNFLVLNRILRKLLRIIFFKRPTESINHKFQSLRIMNFSQYYIWLLLKLFCKIKDNTCNSVGLYLEKDVRSGPYHLREDNLNFLRVDRPNTKFGKVMIKYRILSLINYVHRLDCPILDESTFDLKISNNGLKDIVFKLDCMTFLKSL